MFFRVAPHRLFLFNLILDPFLTNFEEILVPGSRGVLRACADDIGTAMKHIRVMKELFDVFFFAKKYANLTLKPQKCVLVPLVPHSFEMVSRVKAWLRANIPSWANFRVEDSAKYLGFMLGPGAMRCQWLFTG